MKIASFNAWKFGEKKVLDQDVCDILVKIVSRYDIILILEVVDKSGNSIKEFMEKLNRDPSKPQYETKRSDRLGTTKYKEQFLFIYRKDVVKVKHSYQYEDKEVGEKGDDKGVFERMPYIVHFNLPGTVLGDIVLIPVHTKPKCSREELKELDKVVDAVPKEWNAKNIMILGDFNADNPYVTKKALENIPLRTDNEFHWLIKDDVGTTTREKKSAYDRIVVHGQHMVEAVIPDSAKPFIFEKEFGLSTEKALKVSDHCPVEVELRRAPLQTDRGAPPQTDRDRREMIDKKQHEQLPEIDFKFSNLKLGK